MAELTAPLLHKGLVAPSDLVGCTAEEIEALMAAQGVTTLPAVYREFLEYGGHTPYWLAREEWDYTWLLEEAKGVAREIVVDDDGQDWAPFADAFIFQTHHGYMFNYFRASDLTQPDPHFWIYCQGAQIESSGQPFSQYLQDLAGYLPEAIRTHQYLYHQGSAPNPPTHHWDITQRP
ncbi:SMI1/KNR4 family protein [Actinomadura sp. WMMB 499]|uniref:SMI1/KNR4 family protein n=1 Tax=Actinomadura sp. WMMB 499 TaxID=1219491 RepID=UPI00124939BF|nr:SMI1/KNR4 family protein [Actinomadura sp. WMMB 499]QFG23189.1 SMI1/KNR4 family protein [Actinomadura sp. WMMB 499]